MTEDELPSRFYNPYAGEISADIVIARLADIQIRKAIERGEFDDLPGAGEPLDLSDHDDPNWWLHGRLKREGLVLLPPSIQLRKDDAALDERLDRLWNEEAVRRTVEQFNERVVSARLELPVGPPLITQPRDVEATVAAWADRKARPSRESSPEGRRRSTRAQGSEDGPRTPRTLPQTRPPTVTAAPE